VAVGGKGCHGRFSFIGRKFSAIFLMGLQCSGGFGIMSLETLPSGCFIGLHAGPRPTRIGGVAPSIRTRV